METQWVYKDLGLKIVKAKYNRKFVRATNKNALLFENQQNLSKKKFKKRRAMRLSIRQRLLNKIDGRDLDQVIQQLLYQVRRENNFDKTADLLSLKSLFDQNLISVGHVLGLISEFLPNKDNRLSRLKLNFESVDFSDNLKICQLMIG